LHAGVTAYGSGDFAAAKNFFEEIPLEKRTVSIFQNLALAEAQLGNLGPCVLNLRRALEMNPANGDLTAALNDLLREADLPPFKRSWTAAFAQIFTYGHWGVMGTFSLWIAIACAIFLRFRKNRRRWLLFSTIFFGLGAGAAGWNMGKLAREEREAIVLRDTTTQKIPSSHAPATGFLRAGTRVYHCGKQRQMILVQTIDGKKWYIAADDSERILDLANDSRF
jgi:hypothetical protein